MKTTTQYKILYNSRVNGSVYKMVVDAPGLADIAKPGQFAMLDCGPVSYLRRPLSFCDADADAGTVTFMYRVGGIGTRELAARKPGELLDSLGPLGDGFEVISGKTAVVGGGIGVFPLLLLVKRLCEAGAAPDVFIGFQTRADAVLYSEFSRYCEKCVLLSDDGSTGRKGFVTDAFAEALDGGAAYNRIYACGPAPMFMAIKHICETRGVSAQVSLEQRMGCGVGACLTCACKINAHADTGNIMNDGLTDGAFTYARVCKDGPVFDINDVCLDD